MWIIGEGPSCRQGFDDNIVDGDVGDDNIDDVDGYDDDIDDVDDHSGLVAKVD